MSTAVGERPARADQPAADPGPPPWTRRERWWLLGIVGVALVLRWAWALHAARDPVGLIDPTFYMIYGDQFAAGNGYTLPDGQPTAYYPVGYPAALGAVFWLGRHTFLPDDSPSLMAAFNIVLALATVVLVAELARRLFRDNRLGLVAAAVVALWPNLVFHSAVALTETLFNFLVVAGLVVLVAGRWADRRLGPWRLLAAGVLFGVSALVRPITFLLLPPLFVVWIGARFGWRRALQHVALVAVAMVAVCTPWAIRNVRVMDSLTLSTNLGDNLCIGRHKGASGGYSLTEECFPPGRYDHLRRPEYETRRNAETTEKAVRYVLHHPFEEVRLIGQRARITFRSDHDGLRAAESYDFDRFLGSGTRGALAWIADAFFFAACALTVLALPRLWRTGWASGRLLVLTMLAMALPPLIFFGDVRFHLPVLPFMAGAVAVALVQVLPGWWTAARRRRGSPAPA
jgi:4-amino-4-deoxy-L-arabinose transferase-like glycosyltransferase